MKISFWEILKGLLALVLLLVDLFNLFNGAGNHASGTVFYSLCVAIYLAGGFASSIADLKEQINK